MTKPNIVRKMEGFRAASYVCLLTCLVLGNNMTRASEAHETGQLQVDAGLTLSALLDTTLERHPKSGLIEARSATADAEIKYARSWIPEATELTAFHMSDKVFDDIGAYENEVAVSFPLWLPGEKKAQTMLGERLEVSRDSSDAEFRWQVSGQVRQHLWQLKLAISQWQLALEQEQRMTDVMAHVTLFAESGEFSRADQLAAIQELAILKSETIMKEAQYMDAIRMYSSFTGLGVTPEQIEEELSEVNVITETHPALRSAMDRLETSFAATEIKRRGTTARPSLDVFWRGFRGDASSPKVNTLGVGFAVPLGQSPRRNPEVAKAFEKFAEAQSEVLALKRELDLQLHETSHQLHTIREQLENSDAMMQTASEKYQLDKLAFELGEFSTSEWLRRLSQFKKIEREHEMLLIQQGAAIAAYNQAVGESL